MNHETVRPQGVVFRGAARMAVPRLSHRCPMTVPWLSHRCLMVDPSMSYGCPETVPRQSQAVLLRSLGRLAAW